MKTPKCKICGHETEISFTGYYPIISCKSCGNITDEWKKWWEKYSERWKEDEYWNNLVDKPSCLIGYFCHKFNEFYGFPYTFDAANPVPYKGKEFTIARRLIDIFDGNAREAALYIKWAFLKKVVVRKRPITSIGFFSVSNIINEYKHAKALSIVLKRSSLLPEDFLEFCKREYPEIFEKQDLKTWNDLNTLVSFIQTFNSADMIEYKVVIEAVKRNMLPLVEGRPYFRELED